MENNKDTKAIVKQDQSISGLYYNNKTRSDEQIRNFLTHCKIVKLTNKGIGTVQRYYPLSDDMVSKITKAPRRSSLTFDTTEVGDESLIGVREFKEVEYLVKSTSRFFLKPDIGEIIDQLSFNDLHCVHIKGILFTDGYEILPHTGGEHFKMKVILLVDENTISRWTVNSGWICTKN